VEDTEAGVLETEVTGGAAVDEGVEDVELQPETRKAQTSRTTTKGTRYLFIFFSFLYFAKMFYNF
jgi:hypothetical protein